MSIFSYADWANKFDPSKLGGAQQTFRYDPSWGGSGENSLASMLPMFVQQSPGALQSLGLAEADLGYVPGRYENDSYVADQWNLSDAAKKALSGLSVDELGYGGGKTAKALKDGDGNILGVSKPISPAGGDLLENAIMGIIAGGTGGILAQGLGVLSPSFNPIDPSTWGGGAASGVGTLPADPFGGAAVPAIAPETLSTAGLGPLSLTPIGKGSGLTGGGLLSGLGSLKSLAPVAGAIAGSQKSGGGTTTAQSKTDPRLDPYLYGDHGILRAAADWFKENKNGINPVMQQGWDMQLGLLRDPALMQQLGDIRTRAMGLLSTPVAPSGYERIFGG